MNASGLNRRIQLLKRTQVKQPSGARTDTWTEVAETWAEKLFLTSRDMARTQGVSDNSEAKFRIRYRADINTTMRVVCDGRTFAITGLEEIGQREGWFVLVREVAGA